MLKVMVSQEIEFNSSDNTHKHTFRHSFFMYNMVISAKSEEQ